MSKDTLNRILDSIRQGDVAGFTLLAELLAGPIEKLFLDEGFQPTEARAARDDFLPSLLLAASNCPLEAGIFELWLKEQFQKALPGCRRRVGALPDEVIMAASMQRRALEESLTSAPGLDVAGRYRAAHFVTGDLWRVIGEEPPTWIAFGDVAGHGLYTGMDSNAVSLCISLAVEAFRTKEPSEMMSYLNVHLCKHPIASKSVDLILLRHDCSTQDVVIASAGTCTIRRRVGHNWERVVVEGTPLGLLPDADYSQHKFHFSRGDCLLLVSDGVTEAENPDGDQYGDAELDRSLAGCNGETAESVVQSVMLDLGRFSGVSDPADDQILLAIMSCGD